MYACITRSRISIRSQSRVASYGSAAGVLPRGEKGQVLVPRYGGIKGPEEAARLADIPLRDELHASLIDQNAQALAGTDAERDPCLARNDDPIFFRNRDRCYTKPRSIGNS